MTLSFIAALDAQNAIGRAGDLPWRLPDDLKFFKRTTLGKPMLMGRKTWDSLKGVLPGRLHVVVSSKALHLPEGVEPVPDVDAGLKRLEATGADEGFVIGGGVLFRELLPRADRLYLTRVHTTVPDADTFFPAPDFSAWNLAWEERHAADEKHAFPFTFQQWERRR